MAQEPLFEFRCSTNVSSAASSSRSRPARCQNLGIGIPVHSAILAIGQTFFQKASGRTLIPPVIIGSSGNFARPIVGEAQDASSAPSCFDIRSVHWRGGVLFENRCVPAGRPNESPPMDEARVTFIHMNRASASPMDNYAHVPHVQRARR